MSNREHPAPLGSPARLAMCLRQATADLHQGVERLPVMARLTAPSVTHADYLEYLWRMAAVFAALEQPLLDALDTRLRDDVAIRPKLPAILEDLARHGHTDRHPPVGGVPPRGADAALGGLYVLEGSTLGGRVIAKHLRRCLGQGLGETSFLDFHGEQASSAWKGFTNRLDQLAAERRLDPGEVIAGARASFLLIQEILGERPDEMRGGRPGEGLGETRGARVRGVPANGTVGMPDGEPDREHLDD
ncbi:MAG: biliverdin-producing heme oxygenase [Sphingobacteriia bacterium]|nr:biliverdin-producing heme oxygenase [Sphingobacteriia bacterium]NCC41047.1 biliverdin-producing heme oxygenase [Gammaproteobacteria bacterium]